jgi:hypothetical protein
MKFGDIYQNEDDSTTLMYVGSSRLSHHHSFIIIRDVDFPYDAGALILRPTSDKRELHLISQEEDE